MVERNGFAANLKSFLYGRTARGLPLKVLVLVLVFYQGSVIFGAAASPCRSPLDQNDGSLSLLRLICEEVEELGKSPGEDIIIWDFHIGPADDDTNQDEHLVILIHDSEGGTKMTIQVTELVPSRNNANIRYGRTAKTIVCLIDDGSAGIVRSDYRDKELSRRLPLIREAVRNKKKLLGIK